MDAEYRELILAAVSMNDKPLLRSLPDDSLSLLMEEGVIVYSGDRWWLTSRGAGERCRTLTERKRRLMKGVLSKHIARVEQVRASTLKEVSRG